MKNKLLNKISTKLTILVNLVRFKLIVKPKMNDNQCYDLITNEIIDM